jgi:hypothetical protein
MIELEFITERLVLQPLAESDLDLMIALFSDPEVVKYVCDCGEAEEIAEAFGSHGSSGWLSTTIRSDARRGRFPRPLLAADWAAALGVTHPCIHIDIPIERTRQLHGRMKMCNGS